MIKPFAFEELLARIRVLLRKPREASDSVCRVDDLEVHLDTHQVFRSGQEIRLSGKEFALLRYMAQNEGSYFPGTGWRNICGILTMPGAPM